MFGRGRVAADYRRSFDDAFWDAAMKICSAHYGGQKPWIAVYSTSRLLVNIRGKLGLEVGRSDDDNDDDKEEL